MQTIFELAIIVDYPSVIFLTNMTHTHTPKGNFFFLLLKYFLSVAISKLRGISPELKCSTDYMTIQKPHQESINIYKEREKESNVIN